MFQIESHVNVELTLMYWEIGNYINSVILDGERGGYGKQILATLSPKLSWSHIVELLPLKTQDACLYYAKDVAERKYGNLAFFENGATQNN